MEEVLIASAVRTPIGQIRGATVGPDDASFDAMVARQSVLAEIIRRDPDVLSVISTVGGGFGSNTVNSGSVFIMLRDKPERQDSAQQVMARLRNATRSVPGINVFFQPVQSINIGTTAKPASFENVQPGDHTLCVIPIPGDLNDPAQVAKIMEQGEDLPLVCELEVVRPAPATQELTVSSVAR